MPPERGDLVGCFPLSEALSVGRGIGGAIRVDLPGPMSGLAAAAAAGEGEKGPPELIFTRETSRGGGLRAEARKSFTAVLEAL